MQPATRIRIPVVRAAIKPPIWEPNDGARNWAAIIDGRATSEPGQRFLSWGGDKASFLVDRLVADTIIEFGADRLVDGPRGGKQTIRMRNRWYGIVRQLTEEYVDFDHYESVYAALGDTERVRSRARGEGEPREVLSAKLEALRSQRKVLDAAIYEVEAELAAADAFDLLVATQKDQG